MVMQLLELLQDVQPRLENQEVRVSLNGRSLLSDQSDGE